MQGTSTQLKPEELVLYKVLAGGKFSLSSNAEYGQAGGTKLKLE
jgi:hypothetical protein